MPAFIAAYDTENMERCLPACRKILEIHERHEMPGTFFIVGRLLEKLGSEYKALFADHPLVEVASHTYSHLMLKDHPVCGPAGTPDVIRQQIIDGVRTVEDLFERKCLGLRPGCGFDDGFQTAPLCLELAREAGLEYVSSQLWGRDYTMPSPLIQAYTYAEQGHPDLWEIPGHGWHDNVVKNSWNRPPSRMIAWPPIMPEAIPARRIESSQEQFDLEKIFIDRAVKDKLGFVSLIWHPWSLFNFDEQLRMLDLLFAYVREQGLDLTTYADYCRQLKSTVA